MEKPAFGRFRKRISKTKAVLGETPVKMLSDASSILAISTKGMALARNSQGSFIARDSGNKASSSKAFGLSDKLSQTHLRSFQT